MKKNLIPLALILVGVSAAGVAIAVISIRGLGRGGARHDAASRPAVDQMFDGVADSGVSDPDPVGLSNTAAESTDSPIPSDAQVGPIGAFTSTSVAVDSASNLAWSRFRGPNGTGVSTDDSIPTQWSDSQNLKWKAKLPGAGSSSPVLTKKYVLVTSYSGYGQTQGRPGNISDLKRHVSCFDRQTGDLIWSDTIDAAQPEDPYQGMGLPEHGYTTNSPVTDGQAFYVFLGKSGVIAYEISGQKRWRVSVGTDSGNRGWGSAASLILYGDLVIVNAAEESKSIYAIHKSTGEVVWESPAANLELSYGTPVIIQVDENRDDIVLAVPGEIWGLNPKTGKLVWYAETTMTENLSPSLIANGKTVYAFGGYRSSGSMALEAGGRGNVTDSNTIWTSRNSSYVASPVLHNDRLYWIDDKGLYYCTDAKTGEQLARSRVSGIKSGGRPVYASPIVINNKIYIQARQSGLFVLEPTVELTVVAQNQFASDDSVFNATPAVDAGQLFLRSYEYLYCVMQD